MKNPHASSGLSVILVFLGIFFALKDLQAQASLGDPLGEAPFTVVLDAGHGGHDPGNLGNGYLEKNIALKIALEAGRVLEAENNLKVIYTRDDDTFVDLYKRGEIANKAQADLFVSVHCDSHSSNAHGAGTFVLGLHANKQNFEVAKKENSVIYLEDNYESRYADYDISSPESVIGLTIMQEEFLDQSILLGKLMQDRFTGNLKRKDRKVKQAGFIVLHQTFMPSILIESGFLTNKEEGAYLNSKKGQQELGQAIADAILEYRNIILSNSTALNTSSGYSTPDTQKSGAPAEVVSVVPALKSPEESDDKTQGKTDTSGMAAADAMKPVESVSPEENTVEKTGSSKNIQGTGEVQNQTLEDLKDNSGKVLVGTSGDEQDNQGDISDPDKEKNRSEPVESVPETSEAPNSMAQISNNEDIVFKVQLMAVSTDMELKPSNFKGLNTLSKEPVNNMYRILYGNTNSYDQAKILQAGARKKGYTQAYIVAYRDGKRIPVKEALGHLSN